MSNSGNEGNNYPHVINNLSSSASSVVYSAERVVVHFTISFLVVPFLRTT